jgi:hypothetical protein
MHRSYLFNFCDCFCGWQTVIPIETNSTEQNPPREADSHSVKKYHGLYGT